MATESFSDSTTEDEIIDKAEKNWEIIEELCKPFDLSDETLANVKTVLLDEMKRGLCKFTQKRSSVKCFPTHVQYLPNHCEKGNFLVLKLCNENCQIIHIKIDDNFNVENYNETYEIPEDVRKAGSKLFDYIADCLGKCIQKREHDLNEEILTLSFIFSFPVKQISLDSAFVLESSNNSICEDVVGQDVVFLLRQAIGRRNDFNANVVILCNHITSTLASCLWLNKNTKIALTFDNSQSNACYLEKMKNITTAESKSYRTPPIMLINTEWGSFGDNGVLDFIRGECDGLIDTNSTNRGMQLFNKMLCDPYLGEMVRILIVGATGAGALFDGYLSEELQQPYAFKMHFLMQIQDEIPGGYTRVMDVLQFFHYTKDMVTQEDCKNVRYICEKVCSRSSNLLAAAISCLIERIGDPHIAIACDSTYANMPELYKENVRKKLRQLTRPEYEFDLEMVEDEEFGAALLGAVITAVEKRTKPIENDSDDE